MTGSTSGIGKGIAEHFSQLGASVVVHGRDAKRGRELVERLRTGRREAEFYEGDLADPDVPRRLVRYTNDRFGGLHVLVNNAASTARGDLATAPLDLWERIMAINLRAPFICLQEAVRIMRRLGGGSIINIGSINAYIGEPKLGPYAVSKGGLMTMTKNAASLLGRDRIRVNQINVGWTETEGEHRVKFEEEGKGPEWLQEAEKTRPFGRLLRPMDVAYAAAYFASDESSGVSGTVMDLEQHPIGAMPNL